MLRFVRIALALAEARWGSDAPPVLQQEQAEMYVAQNKRTLATGFL